MAGKRPHPEWARKAEPSEEIAYCTDGDCGAPVVWRKAPCGPCQGQGRDPNGKACWRCKGAGKRNHPVDTDGGSHFATCPSAGKFRGRP